MVVVTTVASFIRSVHWFIAGLYKFRVRSGVWVLYGDAQYLSVFVRKLLHVTLLAPWILRWLLRFLGELVHIVFTEWGVSLLRVDYTGIESKGKVIMGCKWYGRRWSWPNWCYVVAFMCSDWGKLQTTSVRNAGLRLKFWSRDFSVILCAVIHCTCLCPQTENGLVFFFKFPPLHICSMQDYKVLVCKHLSS